MNFCDMAGCHDMAEFTAEFVERMESNLDNVILEICASCATYWQDQQEQVKITN